MFIEINENELYDLSAGGIFGDIGHAIGNAIGYVVGSIVEYCKTSNPAPYLDAEKYGICY